MPSRLRLARAVFSFPNALASTLVLVTVLTVRDRFNDPDLWWHLKTGEIIWKTHTIPATDPFSFTAYGQPWMIHEWLSQVILYGTWRLGGDSALMLWLCGCVSLLLIAQYALCSAYAGNSRIALIGALTAWLFSTVGLAVRPHILGYLLLTCELAIVHWARSGSPRRFLLLPVVFAVWVNLHGSWAFGMMLLGLYVVCSHLEFRVGLLVARRAGGEHRLMLMLAFVLCLAALLLNPLGVDLVKYPLQRMADPAMTLDVVDEWQPLAFDDGRAWALLGVGSLVFLVPILKSSSLNFEELLILATGFAMAVRHQRMLFVFGLLVAPILSRTIRDAWPDSARNRVLPNAVMMAICAAIAVASFPSEQELDSQVRKTSPVKAVEFIRQHDLAGRMLNDYQFGGYLIWALPEHKVFMDGRQEDVRTWARLFPEYGAWATLKKDPAILLAQYRISFCLIPRGAPMAVVFKYLPGWKRIYSDDLSVIFSKS